MKRYFFITFIAFGFLISTATVLAAGGGGGGSVPSCTQDNWTCSDWGMCSQSGLQTRTCTLSFDCPGIETPKPIESQSCTPPATQSPPPTPTPQPSQAVASPAPTQAAPLKATVPPEPVCAQNTWTCSNWSASCDIYGLEHRTCSLMSVCAGATNKEPAIARSCQKLQCGNKTSLRERIGCRLNLAPAGIARELQIQYAPEECRVIADGKEKQECIDHYKAYKPCWNIPAGEERFVCARNVLKLGPVISEDVKTCEGKTGPYQTACKADVKEKVLYMIKFRLYDLEQRAENLILRGADPDAVADFETVIEAKKQAFDKTTTNAERLRIILDVRQSWQEFVHKVKYQVKTK